MFSVAGKLYEINVKPFCFGRQVIFRFTNRVYSTQNVEKHEGDGKEINIHNGVP